MKWTRLLSISTAAALAVSGLAAARSDSLEAPRQRCQAAIAAEAETAELSLVETMGLDIGGGNYLFQLQTPDGTAVTCQFCEQTSGATCVDDGLRLSTRPADGELRELPSELDRKCLAALRRELVRGWSPAAGEPDPIVGIETTASHTDSRFVFQLTRDSDEYRCVIRRSDGSYRLEQKVGEEWDALGAGRMF